MPHQVPANLCSALPGQILSVTDTRCISLIPVADWPCIVGSRPSGQWQDTAVSRPDCDRTRGLQKAYCALYDRHLTVIITVLIAAHRDASRRSLHSHLSCFDDTERKEGQSHAREESSSHHKELGAVQPAGLSAVNRSASWICGQVRITLPTCCPLPSTHAISQQPASLECCRWYVGCGGWYRKKGTASRRQGPRLFQAISSGPDIAVASGQESVSAGM